MRYKLIMRSGVSNLNDYEVGLFQDVKWAHLAGALLLFDDTHGPFPEYRSYDVIDMEEM